MNTEEAKMNISFPGNVSCDKICLSKIDLEWPGGKYREVSAESLLKFKLFHADY